MRCCKTGFRCLLWALWVGMASACVSLSEESGGPLAWQDRFLTASQEGRAGTRTTLDGDGLTILWQPREEIKVFQAAASAKFVSDNDAEARVVRFRGSLPDPASSGVAPEIFGLYPYAPEASLSGETLTTILPAVQKGVAGTFGPSLFVSIGRTTTDRMSFYNVCSGLRFQLDRSDIRAVTFLANGSEALAGTFSVAFDPATGFPGVSAVPSGVSEVRLEAPDGGTFSPDTWYYMVLLPAVLQQGYTILLEGDHVQGAVRSTEPLALHRNRLRSARLDAERVDYVDEADYDIVNPGVRAYLEQVDYSSDPEYRESRVLEFQGSDIPSPVKISWKGAANRLRISRSADGSGYREIPLTSSPAAVYNLIPGERYFYTVLASDGSVRKTSCIIPKGRIRMIKGLVPNVRDLGGWRAGDRTLRYGRLLRGYKLEVMEDPEAGRKVYLEDMGVTAEMDLRGYWEAMGHPSFDGVEYNRFDVQKYFNDAAGQTCDQYQQALRQLLAWLSEGKTVYMHCWGGADRTGTLAFLLEALLGVSESDLSKDYELTTFCGDVRQRNGTEWKFRDMVAYLRTSFPGDTIQEIVTAWAKTRFSNSVDPLTDQEIASLKALLLD